MVPRLGRRLAGTPVVEERLVAHGAQLLVPTVRPPLDAHAAQLAGDRDRRRAGGGAPRTSGRPRTPPAGRGPRRRRRSRRRAAAVASAAWSSIVAQEPAAGVDGPRRATRSRARGGGGPDRRRRRGGRSARPALRWRGGARRWRSRGSSHPHRRRPHCGWPGRDPPRPLLGELLGGEALLQPVDAVATIDQRADLRGVVERERSRPLHRLSLVAARAKDPPNCATDGPRRTR